MHGLKELLEAVKTIFPNVTIQNCIIHQVRKAFMADLKESI